MGDVNIDLSNGGLGGTLQTADGIGGLVITGLTGAGYTLGTPLLLTGITSATAAGFTEADSPFIYKVLADFYNMAGDGAQLYILPVADTITLAYMATYTNTANSVRKLLEYAQGAVKVVVCMTDDSVVYDPVVTTHGINEDVLTAVALLDTTLNNFAAKMMPARGVIAGTSYTGVPADLTSLLTYTKARVAVMIGDTVTGANCGIGVLLGRLAAIPVMRKVSRVLDGSMVQTAFLGAAAAETKQGDYAVIAGKGYITWKMIATKSGFYFTGDDTACALNDDYHGIARGRIIDKAMLLAYNTLVNTLDDEIPTVTGGKPEPMWATNLQKKVEQAIDLTMGANGEIEEVTCFIDLNQNIVSTSELDVVIKIRPVGYASDINVKLGYTL